MFLGVKGKVGPRWELFQVFNGGDHQNRPLPHRELRGIKTHTSGSPYRCSGVDVGAEGEEGEDLLEIAPFGGFDELPRRLALKAGGLHQGGGDGRTVTSVYAAIGSELSHRIIWHNKISAV